MHCGASLPVDRSSERALPLTPLPKERGMSSIENVARDRPVSGQEDTFSLLPDAGEGSGMRAARS